MKASDLRISRQRAKRLSGKFVATPFLPAFAATKLVEVVLPRTWWAWVLVFLAGTLAFVFGHQFLAALDASTDKLDTEQTTLPDHVQRTTDS